MSWMSRDRERERRGKLCLRWGPWLRRICRISAAAGWWPADRCDVCLFAAPAVVSGCLRGYLRERGVRETASFGRMPGLGASAVQHHPCWTAPRQQVDGTGAPGSRQPPPPIHTHLGWKYWKGQLVGLVHALCTQGRLYRHLFVKLGSKSCSKIK